MSAATLEDRIRAIVAIPDGRLFFSAHDAGAIGEVMPR